MELFLEPVSTLTLTNHSIALELVFSHNQLLFFSHHKSHRLKKSRAVMPALKYTL